MRITRLLSLLSTATLALALPAAAHAALPFQSILDNAHGVRFWYGDAATGRTAQQLLTVLSQKGVYELASEILLGHHLCPDNAMVDHGPDGALDVYLIDPTQPVPYRVRPYLGSMEKHGGLTIPEGDAQPGCHGGRSAVTIIDVTSHYTPLLVAAAHEIFHAYQASFPEASDAAWLKEATATWFEDQVFPDFNSQAEWTSLAAPDNAWSTASMGAGHSVAGPLDQYAAASSAEYSSYLFFYYLTNAAGYPNTIVGKLFDAAAGGRVLDALRSTVDWDIEFKRFALWNWNADPEDRYRDAGEHIAPLGQHAAPHVVTPTRTADVDVDLGHTQVAYDAIDVQPAGGTDVKQLYVDLSALSGHDDVSVEAILQIGHHGQPDDEGTIVEDWSGEDHRTFCRDRAGENVTDAILVVTNRATSAGDEVKGTIHAEARDACPLPPAGLNYEAAVNGHYVTGDFEGGYQGHFDVSSAWTVTFDHRDEDDPSTVEYRIESTNVYEVDGGSSATVSRADGAYQDHGTVETQFQANGTTHNPRHAGDPVEPDPDNAEPDEASIRVSRGADGRGHYEITFSPNGVEPHGNFHYRETTTCTDGHGSTTATENADEHHREWGHSGCGASAHNASSAAGALETMPVPTDAVNVLTGTYDPATGVIDTTRTASSSDCETSLHWVSDVPFRMASSYQPNDDKSTCSGHVTVRLHVRLPAAR
jgi:hypothetical protein